MIIVRVAGGLGNQMFQYAFYRKLSTIYKDVRMDITSFFALNDDHNGYELADIFPIRENYATISEIEKLSTYKFMRLRIFLKRRNNKNTVDSSRQSSKNVKKNILVLIKKKIKEIIVRHINTKTYYREGDCRLNIINQKTDVYYDGYWQDVSYFEDIINIIRDEFKFIKPLNDRNNEMLKMITNHEICSVSVHIRRGDYVTIGSDCLSRVWYEKAFIEIESKYLEPHYFIFSDDIELVKKDFIFLRSRKCHFIYWNKNKESYIDMQLMSACKHNIIANSTFSWWAALLNNNKEKIIVSPDYFFTSDKRKRRFLEDTNVIEIALI